MSLAAVNEFFNLYDTNLLDCPVVAVEKGADPITLDEITDSDKIVKLACKHLYSEAIYNDTLTHGLNKCGLCRAKYDPAATTLLYKPEIFLKENEGFAFPDKITDQISKAEADGTRVAYVTKGQIECTLKEGYLRDALENPLFKVCVILANCVQWTFCALMTPVAFLARIIHEYCVEILALVSFILFLADDTVICLFYFMIFLTARYEMADPRSMLHLIFVKAVLGSIADAAEFLATVPSHTPISIWNDSLLSYRAE